MCGRFSLSVPPELLAEWFRLTRWVDIGPRWNIAPMQEVAALALGTREEVTCTSFRWGLVPSWAKEESIGNRMINARSETAHEKPAFREALEIRRCAIPADGFYEWQVKAKVKRPYRIMPTPGIMVFAGLWEEWHREDGTLLRTFTILTTRASAQLREYHERMPVMLRVDAISRWLDAALTGREAMAYALGEGSLREVRVHRVSMLVNSPAHDVPEVAREVEEDAQEEGEQGELW